MYKHKDSVYKQNIRDYLFESVTSWVPDEKEKRLHGLTLCNLAFSLETRLAEHYTDMYMNCIEYDKLIFRQIKKMSLHPQISINRMDVFDFPCFGVIKPSFIWLDFCNSYSDNFITKLVTFLNKVRFADRAVLSITMNKKRGEAEKLMVYNGIYPNYKDEGFAHHITQFLNGTVIKVEKQSYICRDICSRGSQMNVFTFFIENNKNIELWNSKNFPK